MKTAEKRPTKMFQKLGIVGIGLCVLCCTLPIVGIFLGVGVLSGFAIYLEKVGFIVLILSAGFLAISYFLKRKPASSCSTSCGADCDCKSEAVKAKRGN